MGRTRPRPLAKADAPLYRAAGHASASYAQGGEDDMTHYVLAVMSAAKEGRDDEYNQWYDSRHMDEMLAMPGIVSGRRLQVAPGSPGTPPARYLTEFDIDADDPQTVLGEMARRAQSGEMSVTDAVDQSQVHIWIFERR